MQALPPTFFFSFLYCVRTRQADYPSHELLCISAVQRTPVSLRRCCLQGKKRHTVRRRMRNLCLDFYQSFQLTGTHMLTPSQKIKSVHGVEGNIPADSLWSLFCLTHFTLFLSPPSLPFLFPASSSLSSFSFHFLPVHLNTHVHL